MAALHEIINEDTPNVGYTEIATCCEKVDLCNSNSVDFQKTVINRRQKIYSCILYLLQMHSDYLKTIDNEWSVRLLHIYASSKYPYSYVWRKITPKGYPRLIDEKKTQK